MAPYGKSSAPEEAVGVVYLKPPGLNQTVEDGHHFVLNGTQVYIRFDTKFKDSELNELLYVIIVIVFYATALMTLIITQIRRQRREGMDVDYYDEYLQRNQEVKRACQTATTIVMKAKSSFRSKRSTGGGAKLGRGRAEEGRGGKGESKMTEGEKESAGFEGRGSATSGALLEPPARARDLSPRGAPRFGGYSGLGRGSVSGFSGGSEDVGCTYTPSVSPRDLSPMLESIPDIGT